MADSTPDLDQLSPSQANKELRINELFDAASQTTLYGRRAATTTGLTWGYFGGRIASTAVANGTASLTASQTNYVVANRSTFAVSVSTSSTNWDNQAAYMRLYKVITGTASITSYEDHRTQAHIALFTAGRHAISVMAGSMQPSASGGCAALAIIASAANQPDIVTLNFDASTPEYAQFAIPMPKSWNEGTVTFKPIWSHAATTTNFGVVWELQAVAIGDNETIAASYGTAQSSTDTGGTTDRQYIGPESSAITIAGTPAAEDVVYFRISRATGNGSDNMAIDARLHGIVLFITTDADTDA